MAKQKEKVISNGIVYSINKTANYLSHKIILNGIDEKRTQEFNEGKIIEVTENELKEIGYHRWLISEVI